MDPGIPFHSASLQNYLQRDQATWLPWWLPGGVDSVHSPQPSLWGNGKDGSLVTGNLGSEHCRATLDQILHLSEPEVCLSGKHGGE